MSIRLSLTPYWAAVMTVILVVARAAVFLLFQRQQWGRLDGALMEEADTAAEAISRLGPHIAHQMILRLSEEHDLGPNRRVWSPSVRNYALSNGLKISFSQVQNGG